MTTKVCPRCSTEKSLEEFSRSKYTLDGRKYACRPCINALNKENHLKNPNIRRNTRLKNEHGITLEQYNSTFATQNGCCAICNIHQSQVSQRLHVDHNHATGENRELLCSNCNTAIGLAKEDMNTLNSMINYLKRHQNIN